MLTTREAILLKVEQTYKTDPTPSASTDAILVSELSFSNEAARMIDRPLIKPSISTEKKIFGGTLKKITFKAELKGSGTAGTAPEIGQALRSCGMSEVVVSGTSVTYEPVSTDHESCAIYYYEDGRLKKMLGCRGNVTIDAEAGALGSASFEFTGHDGGFVDATFPTLSYDSTVPVPFINVSFSIDSYPSVIGAINLDAGNSIATPTNVRDTYGFGEIRITSRDPNGSIDPEAVLKSQKDFETAWKAGTLMNLTTGTVGSVAGNRWSLDATVAIRDISQGERDQIRIDNLSYGAHETATDDEWSLTFS